MSEPLPKPMHPTTMTDAAAALQTEPYGLVVALARVVQLLDPVEQEDLVVHRQAEAERDGDGDDVRLEARDREAVRGREDPRRDAHGRRDRDAVGNEGFERYEEGAGHQEQHEEGRGDNE